MKRPSFEKETNQGGLAKSLIDNLQLIEVEEAETILQELASVFFSADPSTLQFAEEFFQKIQVVKDISDEPLNLEAKYKSLVEQIHAVVFMASLDKGIGEAYVSPQIEAILGFKQQEWLNDPVRWYKQIHPDDKVRWSVEAAQLFLAGKPLQSVYKVIARDGHTVWFQCEANMVRRKDGRPWFIHGVAFDITEIKVANAELEKEITERKQAEEKLRQSEEKYRELYENASDIIYMYNLDGNFTSINKAAQKITGYSLEEALKINITNIIVQQDLDRVCTLLFPTTEKTTNIFETKIITKDNNIIVVEIICRLIIEHGNPAGIQAIARNITERKQAEELMKMAHDLAVESARLKSQFLANMSHEIRTPLNGIIGMTRFLLDTNLSEKQHKFVEIIRNCGEALLSTINQVLDFSKIEAGKMNIEIIDFNLEKLIEEVVSMFTAQANSKNLEMISHIYKNVPINLSGDFARIRQILINLLGNAFKFTEKGEITVKVKIEADTDDWVMLRFEISDTGMGISPEVSSKLFKPFSQADGSTTRKFGGTGLGLAICKQLVELMEGNIGVESTIGKGSIFWFTAKCLKQSNAILPTLYTPLSKLRVLVLNNNEAIRENLHLQLNTWQVYNDCAEDPIQAIHILKTSAEQGQIYDILIFDMFMPYMNAVELVNAIKSDLKISKTKLIMLTSVNLQDQEIENKLPEIAAYLSKPVAPSHLYNCLVKLMVDGNKQYLPPEITVHSNKSPFLQKDLHILLVEDNEINQTVTLLMLEDLGYTVSLASNGKQAISALSENDYDLIFMDCQMPIMDGYEATAIIRKQEKSSQKHIPIIALTAGAMQSDRQECLGAGMDDYITKPFRVEDFCKVLEKWINTIKNNKYQQNKPHQPTTTTNSEQNNNNHSLSVEETPPEVEIPDESIDLKIFDGLYFLQKHKGINILEQFFKPFFSRFPNNLKLMKEAAEKKDYNELKQLAHKLKGASITLSAKKLAAFFATLERNLILGDTKDIHVLLVNIEKELDYFSIVLIEALNNKHT